MDRREARARFAEFQVKQDEEEVTLDSDMVLVSCNSKVCSNNLIVSIKINNFKIWVKRDALQAKSIRITNLLANLVNQERLQSRRRKTSVTN